ncbi:energy-coupling factor transport system ATP-binding protein [Natranaerovirga pectinivora]|uniref:Energy-coupling factor transport system ATP-binding protein n=1 Tax=Natranaerovirga pectinivora TaxID=682400 RepID=A0A4R3MKG8_9FIRM|nr:energy-coupling factor transporter ATPase [Natranaerovirga pectinivora]TCT14096.1 energy-coupling factor transport system ATP-binding protein [Natranaerovirga pectinivora]
MDKFVNGQGLVFEYHSHNDEEETGAFFRALDGVSIEINRGEFIAVLGHNGSGKSTLAKLINALLKPTEGTLWIKGLDSKEDAHIWDIRQSAGMVFQNPDNQIIGTIVEEDVAFGPENLGIPSNEIRFRVDNALDRVGMSQYKDHSPNKLSGGQKQRIAIAGVMAMKPECIVLDEPTAMLDPRGRKEVIETIKMLNKEEHITVIHITHYMEEVTQADRIIVMDNGKIVMEGAPREIFKRVDELKSLKLDVPQVTELAHLLRNEGIELPEGILTIEEMVGALCQLR